MSCTLRDEKGDAIIECTAYDNKNIKYLKDTLKLNAFIVIKIQAVGTGSPK